MRKGILSLPLNGDWFIISSDAVCCQATSSGVTESSLSLGGHPGTHCWWPPPLPLVTSWTPTRNRLPQLQIFFCLLILYLPMGLVPRWLLSFLFAFCSVLDTVGHLTFDMVLCLDHSEYPVMVMAELSLHTFREVGNPEQWYWSHWTRSECFSHILWLFPGGLTRTFWTLSSLPPLHYNLLFWSHGLL